MNSTSRQKTEPRLTYILLCHEGSKQIIQLVDKILELDNSSKVIIHFDLAGSNRAYLQLASKFKREARCYFVTKRVNCGWGEFSLVQATLNSLAFSVEHGLEGDYFYLLSESCYPLANYSDLKSFLINHSGQDFIEVRGSDWIKNGIREDRFLYHHFLNKRKYPFLFKYLYKLQKFFLKPRSLPEPLHSIKFGSQWWCLRTSTVKKILEYLSSAQGVKRFFHTVWIADECFFQTVVNELIPHSQIYNASLTHFKFDKNGQPEVYSLDQVSDLKLDNKFFIRKLQEKNKC